MIIVTCNAFTYKNPPKGGAVVTIIYSGKTVTDKPVSPVFSRERLDLSWNDVINKHELG